jgi:hypothetical protein
VIGQRAGQAMGAKWFIFFKRPFLKKKEKATPKWHTECVMLVLVLVGPEVFGLVSPHEVLSFQFRSKVDAGQVCGVPNKFLG